MVLFVAYFQILAPFHCLLSHLVGCFGVAWYTMKYSLTIIVTQIKCNQVVDSCTY